jgi:hypothetical protein
MEECVKIKSLNVTDFRCYEKASIELSEPLSIIKGGNHVGKTSLAQAIKLALSKCADGTDPRGAGAMDKVRTGATKAIIEAVVEGKQGLVTLTAQYGPGKAGRTQKIVTDPPSEKVAQGFDAYLDKNQERLSCILDSSYFVAQKSDAQKAILAALVLPTTYQFDPAMVAMAEKHLGKFDWTKSPVAVIDQVYELAYGARRTSKAALAAIRIPQTPAKPEYDSETVQAKLAKLRSEASKEAKAVSGGGTVALGKIEQRIDQEREQYNAAIENRAEVVASRKTIEGRILSASELDKVQRLAAARKLFDQLQGKINFASAEIRAQKEAQAIYSELLLGEDGKPQDHANCPTCTQAITRAFIDGKIAEHKALEQQAAQLQISLLREQKELGDIASAEAEIQENVALEQHKDELVRKQADLTAKINAHEESIKALNLQYDQAKLQQGAPADTAALDAINEDIAKWESHLSPAASYNATLTQIELLTKQWEDQKAQVSDLETLCTHFGKDGIKAELIAKHIGEFSATVNSVLSTWGYSAKLEIEPYSFLVTTPTGELPLKEISGSERMMFAVALQAAIAVHAKIKMLVVDAADVLVDKERNRLFGCLNSLLGAGTLDQAIVLVSDPAKTKIGKVGVGTYWVEAGKVEKL